LINENDYLKNFFKPLFANKNYHQPYLRI